MQKVTLAQSSATSTVLTTSNTAIGWKPFNYLDQYIGFSDLGSAVATVRVYSVVAGGAEYTVDSTTFTGDNQGKFYTYENYGVLVGFVITYSVASFTGNVFFGSSRSATELL